MAEATARELGRISLEEALGSGYSAQDAVHDLDPDDVAVVDPVNVVHAAPGENATKWAAMRDDEYVLVRMRLGESPEGRQHPLSRQGEGHEDWTGGDAVALAAHLLDDQLRRRPVGPGTRRRTGATHLVGAPRNRRGLRPQARTSPQNERR